MAALKFLRGLKRHNDRDWFNERKAIYEKELKQPLLDVIEAINHGLEDQAPEHVRPAAKSMMRIYRDTRFSKEKLPYKPHVSAWWGRAGMSKTTGAGFYLQISGTEVLLAAGMFMPDRDQLLAARRHLLSHHAEMHALLESPELLATMQPIDGQPLSRAPKGFPPEGPALDLIVRRQWGVSARLPAEVSLAPGFVDEVVRHFHLGIPLVSLLNQSLTSSSRKPIF